ncbi:MAG: hypothetical protein WA082_01230 [Candidatus Moraniibacteriota bacterium]
MSQDIPTEILGAVSIMGSPAPQAAALPKETNPEVPTMSRQESPFLSESSAPRESTPKPPQNLPFAPVENLSDVQGASSDPGAQHGNRLLFIVLGGTIVLTASGLLAWYFMKPAPEENTVPTQAETVVTPESTITVSEPPFSLDMPNYLSVDTETVSPESFQALIQQSGERIRTGNMTQPVEFLLTDKKNNPIAFSRFAYLMKLGFPEELLALLGEPFSLFLYSDAGRVALGLELTLVKGGEAQKVVTQKEASMPVFLQPLLFRGIVVPKEVTFRSGVYKTEAVRFVNIDTAQNISFDYVMRDAAWIIGTSKDTLRAILDKK